jgi:hypothetical protein
MAKHINITTARNDDVPKAIVEIAEQAMKKMLIFEPPGLQIADEIPEEAQYHYLEGYKSALSDLILLGYTGMFHLSSEGYS